MNGKGGNNPKPKLAGIAYLDFTTAETNQPHTYFAGARKLPLSWVMNPVISFTKASNTTGKGK